MAAPMATLQDRFWSNDLSAVWGHSSDAVIGGGQAVLTYSSTQASTLASSGAYSLAGSHEFARITAAGSPDVTVQMVASQVAGDFSNSVGISLYAGSLYGILLQGGTQTASGGVTYSPAQHAWWRIRESSGTVYYETAPPSLSWSAIYSAPYSIALTSLYASVYANVISGSGPYQAVAQSFNTVPLPASAPAIPALIAAGVI